MYRSFYESLSFAWLPTAATVFFVAFFVAAVAYVAAKKKRDFDPIAALPLSDEEKQS